MCCAALCAVLRWLQEAPVNTSYWPAAQRNQRGHHLPQTHARTLVCKGSAHGDVPCSDRCEWVKRTPPQTLGPSQPQRTTQKVSTAMHTVNVNVSVPRE
jgi:hypothetical protein